MRRPLLGVLACVLGMTALCACAVQPTTPSAVGAGGEPSSAAPASSAPLSSGGPVRTAAEGAATATATATTMTTATTRSTRSMSPAASASLTPRTPAPSTRPTSISTGTPTVRRSTADRPTTTRRAAGTPDPTGSPQPTGTHITLADSQFGPILFDGERQAIYLFAAEQTTVPACYGECASAWPPVLTDGTPTADRGIDASRLGTTTRADGSVQVTYGGHPLYYYAHEGPTEVTCHNVDEYGGLWLVVRRDGRAVGS